jgi:hypothetical protein
MRGIIDHRVLHKSMPIKHGPRCFLLVFMLVGKLATLLPRRCLSMTIQRPNSSISEGKLNKLRLKNEGRYRRIEHLKNQQDPLEHSEIFELSSLSKKGDPYNSSLFHDDHADFKAQHNAAFVALALVLGGGDSDTAALATATTTSTTRRPVFYLDGDDGASTHALLQAGFPPSDLYIANEWIESVQILKEAHNLPHCYHGRAQQVLKDHLSQIPFCAVYLDGCGGATQPLEDMIQSIFQGTLASRLAIGFTLTNADRTGRELIDRIQDVTRATNTLAKQYGYDMVHVGDDPVRFGVDPQLPRKHDGTTTCWLVVSRRAGESTTD